MDQTLKDFMKDMQDFENKIVNKVIRDGIKAGAKSLVAPMKDAAPVATGLVRSSVKVRPSKRSKNWIKYYLTVSGGHPDNIIGFVALGTKKHKTDHFIFKTFEAHELTIRNLVFAKIKSGIDNYKG